MRSNRFAPECESIVMLRRQDELLHAGFFRHCHPLARIQIGRGEQPGRFVAVPPFAIRECVYGEVEESDQLHPLILDLAR